MVNQLLTESDILDYLMTSDFNDGLTNEESRFLLLRYRNFYRTIHAKYTNLKDCNDNLQKELSKFRIELDEYKLMLVESKHQIEIEKNRKLTLKERILGKKIMNNK